eukprot:TRINITY_DN3794_c0_g2_i2.p1 TRINITY_DN3794_c0_g2~~TRINITY_DN3794_c0_g2_i2.p1  ORF type:complete len:616 (-),score=162.84 TRINITY_DN3794_c0_g2_i2:713-2560(-)
MEKSEATKKKSEPALVPEWLKSASSGVNSSGGGSLHHFASSSQSDDHAVGLPTRNRSSVSSSDHDSPRSSAFMDRTSSSYFRRSSSTNGSMMHDKEPSVYSRNYSSFRSHRDRDWDKDLDFRLVEPRSRDHSDSLLSANILTSRIEKDTLRRSQSMISGKRGEGWPKRVGNDLSNGIHTGGNIISNKHKSSFDRDFPTLGAEEKQGVPEIGRVSSPGLSTACQSLPMGTMSVIGGDGWTSALVELPATVGSNSTILHSVQQTAPASSTAVHPSISTGLNMAETLAQAPSRARAVPQISVEIQRLEELAIKQCRQLIPMTPSMPKNLVQNSSEKTKTKVARSGELSTVAKVGQQPSSSQLVVNIRGSARSDTSKTSPLGKLQPLKGPRESNGVSSTSKDGSSPTSANRSPHGTLRSPGNPKLTPDLKLTPSTVTQSSMDRKPLPQKRNEFFNSLRRKSAVNHSTATPDSSSSKPSVPEKLDEQSIAISASVSMGDDTLASKPGLECLDWSTENGIHVAGNGDPCIHVAAGNGDACKESEIFADEGGQTLGSDEVVIPDEEAAFLRMLGWEENAKYEALTEEEISAFYNEHKEKRPASKLCQRMQQLKTATSIASGQ